MSKVINRSVKLSALCITAILAGCASQSPAPVVDAGSGAYGPSGPQVQSQGLGAQGKSFTGEQLAKYNAMINDASGYSTQQKSQILQALSQQPSVVYFGFDSFQLTPESQSKAKEVSSFLLQYPKQKLRLEGHTDPRGSESYNLNLGQKRADSVYNYLLKQGVSKDQICTVSYGELRPAISPQEVGGDWKKAHQLDRRVEFDFGQTCQGA